MFKKDVKVGEDYFCQYGTANSHIIRCEGLNGHFENYIRAKSRYHYKTYDLDAKQIIPNPEKLKNIYWQLITYANAYLEKPLCLVEVPETIQVGAHTIVIHSVEGDNMCIFGIDGILRHYDIRKYHEVVEDRILTYGEHCTLGHFLSTNHMMKNLCR